MKSGDIDISRIILVWTLNITVPSGDVSKTKAKAWTFKTEAKDKDFFSRTRRIFVQDQG